MQPKLRNSFIIRGGVRDNNDCGSLKKSACIKNLWELEIPRFMVRAGVNNAYVCLRLLYTHMI
jgi:hypothetical protein